MVGMIMYIIVLVFSNVEKIGKKKVGKAPENTVFKKSANIKKLHNMLIFEFFLNI